METGKNATMRHMNRAHGVSIASLHEKWKAGSFRLEYVPSSLQAADIFTKNFTTPVAWQAVCRLVGICPVADVPHMVRNLGIPYGEAPSADGKHGLFFIRADGSGAWCRRDRRTDRYRVLKGTGPQQQEIVARHTFCCGSREQLGPPMLDFASNSKPSELLPGPTPRDVLSIFVFKRTSQNLIHTAVSVPPKADIVTYVLDHVLPK